MNTELTSALALSRHHEVLREAEQRPRAASRLSDLVNPGADAAGQPPRPPR